MKKFCVKPRRYINILTPVLAGVEPIFSDIYFRKLSVNKKMTNIAVIGLGFGDEGKGRIVHYMSRDFDYVCRYSGGNNAGHTLYVKNLHGEIIKVVHHLVPSVDFSRPHTKAFLGCGMVINLESLLEEVKSLEKIYPGVGNRIIVDPYAFLVTDEHIEQDKAKNKDIGSTNKGIGPAYMDKASRRGQRIIDTVDLMYSNTVKFTKEMSAIGLLMQLGVQFKSVYEMLPEFKTKSLLFEGCQGVMLDLNFGTYGFVSNGDSTIAGIGASGFNSIKLDKVFGVTKAYTTRVGAGPFKTQDSGPDGEKLRTLGHEFGATTGRPRKTGWLDLPALKYACEMGGVTDIIVTKLDILADTSWEISGTNIPVCISYFDMNVTGPRSFDEPERYGNNTQVGAPIYSYLPGWDKCLVGGKLHDNLVNYLKFIEKHAERPVSHVSIGVNDEDFIEL